MYVHVHVYDCVYPCTAYTCTCTFTCINVHTCTHVHVILHYAYCFFLSFLMLFLLSRFLFLSFMLVCYIQIHVFPCTMSTYCHFTCVYMYMYMYMYTCRFLSILENEIYNASSPIWREDFNQTPEALTVPSPVGSSSITPSHSPSGPSSVPTGPGSVPIRSGLFY